MKKISYEMMNPEEFLYYLEKDGRKLFYSRNEIVKAIKNAINIEKKCTCPVQNPKGDK